MELTIRNFGYGLHLATAALAGATFTGLGFSPSAAAYEARRIAQETLGLPGLPEMPAEVRDLPPSFREKCSQCRALVSTREARASRRACKAVLCSGCRERAFGPDPDAEAGR